MPRPLNQLNDESAAEELEHFVQDHSARIALRILKNIQTAMETMYLSVPSDDEKRLIHERLRLEGSQKIVKAFETYLNDKKEKLNVRRKRAN